jgi:hypothetical protein
MRRRERARTQQRKMLRPSLPPQQVPALNDDRSLLCAWRDATGIARIGDDAWAFRRLVAHAFRQWCLRRAFHEVAMERGRFAKALGRQRASAAPLRFSVFVREQERTNQI